MTRLLRHVEELPGKLDGRRKKMADFRVGFWSADWSLWQALLRLRRSWPELLFVLVPDYAPGGMEGQGGTAAEASPGEKTDPSSVSRARPRRG
ncbi:hypothetical protein D9599_24600 [Roseomonas sp. KE2513]|uniref:hypothetical protein n=1 Tax=Roseomonas sp. KE2513 TaxID=2479202 RepID=UPI0018DFD372|nr:hypothetical protein [Roseomonas sp. KE2513]MBI0538742.1 hypothetical protein [Roseomonas sp. KE2513]